jgi:hypothetical protein
MYTTTAALAVVAALASTTSAATLNINNWCNTDVFVYTSTNGDCDKGYQSDRCQGDPWLISAHTILKMDYHVENNIGTSVKISKGDKGFRSGILQFEYSFAPDGFYWDLSDLDGNGPSLVGTPFRNDNVKATPTGNGSGVNTW